MTTYTATFADGTTITRNSDRVYTAAWRVTWINREGVTRTETGFSINPEVAKPYNPAPYRGGNNAKQKAEVKRMNDQFLADVGYQVEIVPATAA